MYLEQSSRIPQSSGDDISTGARRCGKDPGDNCKKHLQREEIPRLFDTSNKDIKFCLMLDGSELAETAITPTLYLAAASAEPQHREVHLFRVIKQLEADQIEAFQRVHGLNIHNFLFDEAKDYLQQLSERLNKDTAAQLGVHVTWSVRMGRNIAEAIINEAEGNKSEHQAPLYALIALTTHGRSGIARWLVGSVAEQIFQNSRLPLFVVHPNHK